MTRDKTYGFERRLSIIPFDRQFVSNPTGNQLPDDKNVTEKLLAELDGILAFALRGLHRLQSNGYEFTYSAKSAKLLEQYILDINPYLDFFRDCIKPSGQPKVRVDYEELYKAFCEWCAENGHRIMASMTKRGFIRELRKVLQQNGVAFDKQKSDSHTYFTGITLSDAAMKLLNRVGNRSFVGR